MEEPRHKFLRTTMGAIFILLLIGSLTLSYLHYYGVKETPKNTIDTSSESAITGSVSNNDGSSAEQTPTTKTALDHYNKAIALSDQKNYLSAIDEITSAINIEPKNEIFWSKKASFYALLGNNTQEEAALREGLAQVPDSDLLKTRLDLINQDISSSADGVRE